MSQRGFASIIFASPAVPSLMGSRFIADKESPRVERILRNSERSLIVFVTDRESPGMSRVVCRSSPQLFTRKRCRWTDSISAQLGASLVNNEGSSSVNGAHGQEGDAEVSHRFGGGSPAATRPVVAASCFGCRPPQSRSNSRSAICETPAAGFSISRSSGTLKSPSLPPACLISTASEERGAKHRRSMRP